MNFLFYFFINLILFALLLGGCAKTQEEKELRSTENNVSIRIEGAVYPLQKQDVISSVAGYVKDIYVKNGDKVKKGDLLFSLDKELINLDIENKKIQIASIEEIKNHVLSKNIVEGSIPAINLAAMELKKMALLRSKGYISKFQENTYKKNYINVLYSNKNNNTDNFEKIKNLNKQLKIAKIELKKLEYSIKHADGYAQIDGFIANMSISKGTSLGVNRKVCSIVNIDNVLVKAGFSTGLLPFVSEGKKVNISFVTTPPYRVDATIKQVNPIISDAFGRMTVEIVIPNNNYILQEGTRALVTIPLSKEGQEEVRKYFLHRNRDDILQVKSKI